MSPALHATPLNLPSRSARQTGLSLPVAPERSESASALESTEILRGHKAVAINHNGLTYRLQATRLGKLILTK